MTSRYLSLRPDNINPDATISFKSGFPVLTFTIQSQAGILDPRSIRINGEMCVFKDNASPPTPVYEDDAANNFAEVTMDNRLGVFGLWDQLIIRHNKSKQICEHIRHYNAYLKTYLGLTSSKQDLMGHLNEACLIQPDAQEMFDHVVCSGGAQGDPSYFKNFSCHLPSGFMMSGNQINLLENSFGGIQIEIHLSPDSNCLFARGDDLNLAGGTVADAHYQLKNLSLTCEVMDIPASELPAMMSQTSGALEFNTITSLYTSINTSNAQLQYRLGLRHLQSVFCTFTPSSNINTLLENGLATVYPSQDDNTLVGFTRVQFLKGGAKYPVDFDMLSNTSSTYPLNTDSVIAEFNTSDSQLAKQFIDAVIPEFAMDRTSIQVQNLNRDYTMTAAKSGVSYKEQAFGGPMFGIGMRYSQYNKGQDFSQEQWGLSLESGLTTDNPHSVFMFFKAKSVLTWDGNSVQVIS